MNTALLSSAWLQVLRWIRTPSLVAATIVPALGMGLMVLALSFAVGRQPVALVAVDRGGEAESILTEIRHSDGFIFVEESGERAERDLREQRVAAIITVPEGFNQRAAGGAAVIDVKINNVDLDFADDIRRSVTEVIARHNLGPLAVAAAAVEEAEGEATGFSASNVPNPYRVGMKERDLRGRDVELLNYQLVSVLVLLALTTGLLVTALSLAGDRQTGLLRLQEISPASRLDLTLGRLLGGTLASAFLLALAVVPAALTGAIKPPPGRWPLVAYTLFLTAVSATGLGILIGMATRRVGSTVMLGINIASAAFLLGGGFTTIAFLPTVIQRFSHAMPTFYSVEALREALFYRGMPHVATDLRILIVSAAASVTLGVGALHFNARRITY